jgi:hypothetical protein
MLGYETKNRGSLLLHKVFLAQKRGTVTNELQDQNSRTISSILYERGRKNRNRAYNALAPITDKCRKCNSETSLEGATTILQQRCQPGNK